MLWSVKYMKEIYITPFKNLKKVFYIEESLLKGNGLSLENKYNIIKHVYNIEYVYNNNFITKEGHRLTIEDIITSTQVEVKYNNKKEYIDVDYNKNNLRKYTILLNNVLNHIQEVQNTSDIRFKLYSKYDIEDDINLAKKDSKIYTILESAWEKLNIKDIDDECNIVSSYSKLYAFIINGRFEDRCFAYLCSPITGWGKSYMTRLLLEHTNGVYRSCGQKKEFSKFSMSNIPGSDFYQIDDPTSDNHSDLCRILNEVIATHTTTSEKKSYDEVIYKDVNCKFIVTANILFNPRNDNTNLALCKMIEVITNTRDVFSRQERLYIQDIMNEIANLPQDEYDKYNNLCIRLLEEDPEFISRHLRVNKNIDETLETAFNDIIDISLLERAKEGCKLSEITNTRNNDNRSIDKDVIRSKRSAYIKICDTLDRKFNLNACSLSSSSTYIYNRSYGIKDKKNFYMTRESLEYIASILSQFTQKEIKLKQYMDFDDVSEYTSYSDYINHI